MQRSLCFATACHFCQVYNSKNGLRLHFFRHFEFPPVPLPGLTISVPLLPFLFKNDLQILSRNIFFSTSKLKNVSNGKRMGCGLLSLTHNFCSLIQSILDFKHMVKAIQVSYFKNIVIHCQYINGLNQQISPVWLSFP